MRVKIPKDWRIIQIDEEIEHGDYYVYQDRWRAFDQLIGEKYKGNMPLGIRATTRTAIIHLPLVIQDKDAPLPLDAKSRVQAYLKKFKKKLDRK